MTVSSASLVHQFGQAKISHARLIKHIEQNVGRLQIAMQHAALVGVFHGFGDDFEIAGRAPRGQWPFTGQFGKAPAFDEFQRKKMVSRPASPTS